MKRIIPKWIVLSGLIGGVVVATTLPLYAQSTYSQSSGTTSLTGQTYHSSTQDLSAVKVTGGTLTLSNSAISSSGNTSSNDNSSFYGLNAVILAYTSSGSAVINSLNNTVTSSGSGANGIFAYGQASVSSINDKFSHTGNGGHAIMCSGGGTITVINDTAVTSGGSSSVIATDRGSGTITVTGGSYTAKGQNSAAIYSTGVITCTGATLVADGAEALVIEGKNSIVLTGCTIQSNYDKWGSLIYQSMSGDAEGTEGYLTITGGSFSYKGSKGGMFYNTNSSAFITLTGVTLANSCDTLVRCIKGSWGGSTASSGGITHLTTHHQTMSGLIHIDASSKAYLSIQDTSDFTGAINHSNTAALVTLTMDSSSVWTVTEESHLNGLITNPAISGSSVANIVGNGNNIYYTTGTNPSLNGATYRLVNGGYLLPEGSTVILEPESPGSSINLQHYPNPFHDQLTITFNLEHRADVMITLTDMLGRTAFRMTESNLNSGFTKLEYSLGHKLAAGCYILRVTTNSSGGQSTASDLIIKE